VEFNLADLWERVVDTVPDHPALVCADRRLTFAEEDERATRLAHALAARGIGPGSHIACYLYNSIEYLEVMLAAFKLRAVPINVNYRYVEDELRYLLDDADVSAVVFHREFAPKLAAIQASLPGVTTYLAVDDGSAPASASLGADDYETALRAASPTRDFGPRSDDDLYILYTGGTTGMPKGVMWRSSARSEGPVAAASRSTDPRRLPSGAASRAPGAFPRARSCTAPRTGWRSARCSRAAPSSFPASTTSMRPSSGSSSNGSTRTSW
jgi:acyl-CoA synthetase (AMP-forming)/AMP-acid ligase II